MNRTLATNNLWWNTLTLAFTSVISFLFAGILGRTLGPQGLGIYSYVFSFFVFANLFMEAGMPLFFFRQWSKSDSTLTADIRSLVSARLFIFFPLAIAITLYSWFFERGIFGAFILVLSLYFVDVWLQIALLYSQAKNRFDRILIFTLIEKGVGLSGGMLLLILGQPLTSVLGAFLLGKVAALLVAQRHYPLQANILPNRKSFLNLFRKSSPLFLLGLFSTAYFRLDVILIKHFAGLPAVGLYSSSYRLFEAALLLPNLISTSFLSIFTKLIHDRKKNNAEELLIYSLKILFFLALFIAVTLTHYSKEVLHLLYGSDFIDSGLILVILGWTLIFLFINNPLNNYLIANHQEAHQLRFMIFLTIINITINSLLIPRFGILGATITTLLCEVIAHIFFARKTRISLFRTDFAKLLLIAFIPFLLLTLTKQFRISFLIAIPSSFLVYGATALKANVFPNLELRAILHQVQRYIKDIKHRI